MTKREEIDDIMTSRKREWCAAHGCMAHDCGHCESELLGDALDEMESRLTPRPIETAPKDGTWVLIWADGWSISMWQEAFTGLGGERVPAQWWCECGSEPEPTHWLPLPDPPEDV